MFYSGFFLSDSAWEVITSCGVVLWHLHFEAISEAEASKRPYHLFLCSLFYFSTSTITCISFSTDRWSCWRITWGKQMSLWSLDLTLQVSVNGTEADPPGTHFLALKKGWGRVRLGSAVRTWLHVCQNMAATQCLCWLCGLVAEDRGCLAQRKACWCQVSLPKPVNEFELVK